MAMLNTLLRVDFAFAPSSSFTVGLHFLERSYPVVSIYPYLEGNAKVTSLNSANSFYCLNLVPQSFAYELRYS